MTFNKKATILTDETIKRILYFAILVAVGFAIGNVIVRLAG